MGARWAGAPWSCARPALCVIGLCALRLGGGEWGVRLKGAWQVVWCGVMWDDGWWGSFVLCWILGVR